MSLFYENEGIRVQEARSCLLCNTEGVLLYQNLCDRIFNTPGKWTLLSCPKCGLIWLNPRPHPEEIWKIYKTYYTHSVVDIKPVRFASLRETIKRGILAVTLNYKDVDSRWKEKLMGQIFSQFGFFRDIIAGKVMWLKATWRGHLLDVGCGNGVFLSRMRELGWKVVGVEPDPEAVRIARDHFKLKVFQGTLYDIKFPDNYFDVITANHVIEHIHDPIHFLVECRRILKPSGRIVITTPNINSLGHKFFKINWRALEPPRHLFLFSVKTLKLCAQNAGFTIEVIRTTSRISRFIWNNSRILQKKRNSLQGFPNKVTRRLKIESLFFWLFESFLCCFINWGEEILMIAKK